MAILASGHKLVRCGIDGAISGVVTDETLSGNGTSAAPLGVVVGGQGDEEVNQYVYDNSATIDEVNTSYQTNSGNFLTAIPDYYATTGDINDLAQSISETYQVKGDYLVRSDSANFYPANNPSGFITGVDLSNFYTKDETSGKEELAQAFADIPVGDPEVNAYVTNNSASLNGTTDLVQSNSSVWNDITVYQSNSGSYLTAVDLTPYQPKSGMADYQTTAGMIDYAKASALDNLANDFDSLSSNINSNSGSWNEISAVSSNYWPLSASLFSAYNRNIYIHGLRNYRININLDNIYGGPYINSEVLHQTQYNWGISYSRVYGGGNQESPSWFLTKSGVGCSGGNSSANWFYGLSEYNKLNDSYDVVSTHSATWGDITVYQSNSSTYLTAVDLSNYYTKSETSGADELANAFVNIPSGDSEVNTVVHNYSAAGTWLIHDDITGFQEKGDYYSASNPSGFLVPSDISNLATTALVEETSATITGMIPDVSNFITNSSAEATYQTIEGMTAYQPTGAYITLNDLHSIEV